MEYDAKPQPPQEPEPWECCQNGCDPCVYDRYWEALTRYEEQLAAWQARNPATNETRDAGGGQS